MKVSASMKPSLLRMSMVSALCGVLLVPAARAAHTGRYVHVNIPGGGKTLSLAEVQVFCGRENVAPKGVATQCATDHGGDARRAIDGNTSGNWGRGSITHTPEKMDGPTWEVHLKSDRKIDRVAVWNRDGYESRLHGARVAVLDKNRKVVWEMPLGRPGRGKTEVSLDKASKGDRRGKTVPKITAKRRSKRGGGGGGSSAVVTGGTKESLRLAIKDLMSTFGARYPKGSEFLKRLETVADGEPFEKLKREAMLANPLLDFDTILLIERKGDLGMPANWQGNSSLGRNRYDNRIVAMSPIHDGELKTVFQPPPKRFVGDVDLHFDAKKMIFSMRDDHGTWQVFEVGVDGKGLRQVTPAGFKDVDSYDACYLPDGRIIYNSSSGYQGVPCVGGKDYVANLHIIDPGGSGIRRLTFEQDNDWCPVMLPNGRVMFLRWEYTDSAHYFSRVLMHMNPDGTDQKEYYGSNSYWPNSLFYARPVPGSSSKFVGIVTGHHGVKRMGELVLFDTARGRFEADGAVQRIPGYGKKVVAITKDRLVDGSKPKFLHPYPLSEKNFLVSASESGRGGWGIYLVDVFDNMLLLKRGEGALLEPVPLKNTPKPRVVPDRIKPGAKDATLFLTNVYEGGGLVGVPKGTVKSLRVYKYEYSLRNSGGHYNMGMEGPWDAHIILGTVPVEEDGSAVFTIPANTPLALQPLDAEGKALQLMRSWLVAMPGEVLSCIGCHEDQNLAPPTGLTKAARRGPSKIKPWYGPARGFSFKREVQPVLDEYCVGCHDGTKSTNGRKRPNFADSSGKFPKSYMELHPYVRRNGPEGDYQLLTPLEFHADTSELVQMLEKGHNNVKLDDEAWDRLITWIDLNVPALGTWSERGIRGGFADRRRELRKLYAGIDVNPEHIPNPYRRKDNFVKPKKDDFKARPVRVSGWPFDKSAAARKRRGKTESTLDLGDGVKMKLVRIPAGSFPMGSNDETPVERPVAEARIARPFWMGATEVSLKQYRQFDKEYMNGVYDMHYKDQVKRGYFVNEPDFPVIRVSWDKAVEFCRWLTKKTGRKVTLPTEAQWEWACRAGTESPLWFGDLNTDFSKFANLSDVSIKLLAVKGVNPKPITNPDKVMDFELKDTRSNDKVLHLANVGSYAANPWGLHDMHGNVAEWTRSAYKPYPYSDRDGRNDVSAKGKRTIRGGSWHDRQHRSTSSFRLGYPAWQRVYHVGLRVVVED
ncbi:MAG: SUMF1/EgtB/PvdO family nonheme iron enzyme [Planctomycetota bacterium]